MGKIRAFIAIELDEAMRRHMAEAQERLRRAGRLPVRWARPDSAHVTLKFLGEVEPEAVSRIAGAVAQAAGAAKPFHVGFGAIGAFPSPRSARIMWLGLTGETAALSDLRDAVESFVTPLGFPAEARPFTPHVTLARLQDGARPVDLEAIRAGAEIPRESVSQKITDVVLFRSDLSRGGPVYTPLCRFPLTG